MKYPRHKCSNADNSKVKIVIEYSNICINHRECKQNFLYFKIFHARRIVEWGTVESSDEKYKKKKIFIFIY